jgi:hypothetical protein
MPKEKYDLPRTYDSPAFPGDMLNFQPHITCVKRHRVIGDFGGSSSVYRDLGVSVPRPSNPLHISQAGCLFAEFKLNASSVTQRRR